MKASLGILGVAVGASSAGLGIITLARGLWTHDDRLLAIGRRFVFGVLAAALVAVAAMEWALITHDFSLRYVAENNARATPLLFTDHRHVGARSKVRSCSGRSSSPGTWRAVAHRFRHRATDPLVAWANLVGLVVALFFFALMLGPANPFRTLSSPPADGTGPNAAAAEPPADGVPPAPAVSRARRIHGPVRLRDRRRSSPAGSARAGSPRRGGRR